MKTLPRHSPASTLDTGKYYTIKCTHINDLQATKLDHEVRCATVHVEERSYGTIRKDTRCHLSRQTKSNSPDGRGFQLLQQVNFWTCHSKQVVRDKIYLRGPV
jgi:hypothetical protein